MTQIILGLNMKIAQCVLLHDNGRVVLASWGYGVAASVYGENHNIFRLDNAGRVVWQVQRDEQGKLNWDAMHAYAMSRGEDGAREPFMNLLVVHPDGTRKRNPEDGTPLEVDVWEPGCQVFSTSFSGQNYEIDIDAGIARNVTPHRQREW